MALASCIFSAAAARAADKSADEILKELDATTLPTFEPAKAKDQKYVQEFNSKRYSTTQKRSQLILALYKVAPDHEKIPTLMAERWAFNSGGPFFGALKKELDDALATTKNEKLKAEARYAKAMLAFLTRGRAGNLDTSDLEEFLKLAPKDQRGVQLLYMAASAAKDAKAKTALEDRIIKDFPDSMFAGMIQGPRKRREAIGKPFELEFTDAINGSTVSIKGLKGKVVVLDFWATWCGPCVAEMPTMKEIYAKYHDQGVEFIGVSLDAPKEQGGLDKLKKFVEDKKIGWPQYYQGNGWESRFSKSWGINSIPCMFVVDAEGKLYSVEARGQLEKMLPELLQKKPAPAGAGAGAGGGGH
jgi:thiol-disulfide isomerase/thioredoxin